MKNLLTKTLFVSLLSLALIPSGVQAGSATVSDEKFAKKIELRRGAIVGAMVGAPVGCIITDKLVVGVLVSGTVANGKIVIGTAVVAAVDAAVGEAAVEVKEIMGAAAGVGAAAGMIAIMGAGTTVEVNQGLLLAGAGIGAAVGPEMIKKITKKLSHLMNRDKYNN